MSAAETSKGNWPNWPSQSSDDERNRVAKNKESARQRLVVEAGLTPEQLKKVDAETAKLNVEVSRAFDELIAPHVTAGRAVPAESLQKYKERTGETIETVRANISAIVGGTSTMERARFVMSSQLDIETLQRVTLVGDLERDRSR